MEPFKKILVGLDTSELDETLIKYTSFIVDRTSAEHVEFVNVVKNLNIPTDVRKEFPELVETALRDRKTKLKDSIDRLFKPEKKVNVVINVKKGQGGDLVSIAEKGNIDLIIVGQKKTLSGTGVTTLRLARRASCNLLIVPENVTPSAKKLLVPIDFSKHSKLTMEQSIDFSVKNDSEPEIICQNVYSVPAGYHYTGKSFEVFAEIMKKNAEADFKKFMKKVDSRGVKISEVYSLETNDNLASDIYDLADKINPDFVIIGAKGRTAAAALFLGSLAEKMVNDNMNHPLLVIRFKGKNAGLFETLREI